MAGSAPREHRTVNRVTTLLEAVAERPEGRKLTELVDLLDAPKSSVYGLARGLVARGYLLEHGGGYRLGPAIAALLAPPRPSLIEAAQPAMETLQGRCEETVALCSLVGRSVVYLNLVESHHPIRYSAPLRQRRPLYPTSAGKCFLAFGGPQQTRAYLVQHHPDRVDAIMDELVEVRRSGVAYNRGETVTDVTAVAAPIRVDSRVLACLNVAGPTSRMAPKLDEAAAAVTDATRHVAESLS